VSLAARLRRGLGAGAVALVEPSRHHYYQPLWTLVGAGLVPKEATCRAQSRVVPRGVDWICEAATRLQPELRRVETSGGKALYYDALVVATGLQVNYQSIPGLAETLGRNGVCSIYDYGHAEKTAQMLSDFRGGRAVFTMPPVPIKCAGAPQKILYLADQIFRRQGVRAQTELSFYTAGKVIFGVPLFASALMRVAARKGIQVHYSHRLSGVDGERRQATFETESGPQVVGYDLLHAVPPMSPSPLLESSGLAFDSGPHHGWLAVDPHSLQHLRYPNVFGIGDITGIPNSKTAAAIRKQAPVVELNLKAWLTGKKLPAVYDGYSSCPLITEAGKVILAEFGYDGKLLPTVPGDPSRERRSMWWLKRYLLPQLYWKGMVRGRA